MNEGSRSYARQISRRVSQAVDQLRKDESRLKKLLSIPRPNLEKEVVVEGLRDVHGEIARLQSDFDAKSYS